MSHELDFNLSLKLGGQWRDTILIPNVIQLFFHVSNFIFFHQYDIYFLFFILYYLTFFYVGL